MTRLWIGIGLLLILLASGIWLCLGLSPFHEDLAYELEQAAELAVAGEWDEAYRLADTARRQWLGRQRLTAAFINHEPLERAEALFAEMTLMEPEQYRQFAAVCVHLAQTCRAISEPLKLNWWSLL